MTPEEQRIALAEWAGPWLVEWEDTGATVYDRAGFKADFDWSDGIYKESREIPFLPIPNYLNDLNAIHELEKRLSTEQRWGYCKHLLLIFERRDRNGVGPFDYAHATAPQRCEALLKTLNLWKD